MWALATNTVPDKLQRKAKLHCLSAKVVPSHNPSLLRCRQKEIFELKDESQLDSRWGYRGCVCVCVCTAGGSLYAGGGGVHDCGRKGTLLCAAMCQ